MKNRNLTATRAAKLRNYPQRRVVSDVTVVKEKNEISHSQLNWHNITTSWVLNKNWCTAGLTLREGVFAETKEGICRNENKKASFKSSTWDLPSCACMYQVISRPWNSPDAKSCLGLRTVGNSLRSVNAKCGGTPRSREDARLRWPGPRIRIEKG